MARFREFSVPRLGPDSVASLRDRRDQLWTAMVALEEALAAPAPGRVEEWAAGVGDALGGLRHRLTDHVVATESPDGFLRRLVADAPRLANAVDRLREGHTDLLSQVEQCQASLGERTADVDRWAAHVREACTALLGLLVRHRQRGADLVYEAYSVDVGGSE